MAFPNPNTGNESGAIPSVPSGSLPSPVGPTRIVRLSDGNEDLWYSNGITWLPVSGLSEFRFENFGGVAGDTSSAVRTANNTAWNTMMGVMGSNVAATGEVLFFNKNYYFASEIHPTCACIIRGQFAGYNRTYTQLVFPPYSKGIVYDYFSTNNQSGNAQTCQTVNIGVTHDQNLATWQATHTYAAGAAVRPTYWTGFVFVTTAGGISAGSEPTWTTNLQAPAIIEGQTVSDGTVTWVATLCPLIEILCVCQFQNVVAQYGYGNGIQLSSDTTHSIADIVRFDNIWASNNLSAGIFITGSDSQIGTFTNVTCLANGTWGVYASEGYGNNWVGLDCSYNGISPVVKNTNYVNIVDGYVTAPNDFSFSFNGCQNGYLYKTTTAGNTGGTLPAPGAWPTTLGVTITIGAAVFTCVSKWTGGDIRNGNEKIFGFYAETGNLDYYNGGTIYGAANGAVSQDSPGLVTIREFGTPMVLKNPIPSGDATYDSVALVGENSDTLVPFEAQIFTKAKGLVPVGSPADKLQLFYNSTNKYFIFRQGGGYLPLQIPGNLATGRGNLGAGPVLLATGLQTSGDNTGPKMTTAAVPNTSSADIIGDLTWSSSALYRSGLPCFFVASNGGAPATWLEAAWAAAISGARIDVLSEFGETDLHVLVDDSVVETMINLPSRRGGFTASVAGTVLATPAESILGSHGLHVFYDSSQRARKIAYGGSLAGWFALAANAAHVLPTSGQRTLEVVFYCNATSGTQTLWGYGVTGGTAGYQLNVNSDGSLEFAVLNTTPANFIDLKSAAAAVSTGTVHYAAVTFDSTADQYALWLDGAIVASASTHTGTLGTTSNNIGLMALITNNSTVTQGCPGVWVAEWMRTTRILSPAEILNRAQQFRSTNSLAKALPYGVEQLLSTTVIDCSVGTKQSLFTVPTAQKLIVTKIVLRSPSATLTTASLPFGYNANGDDISTTGTFSGLTSANCIIVPISQNVPFGNAADVLGTKLTITQAATLVTADVFGYFF